MIHSEYYTKEEEIANTVTHAAGILMGLMGGYVLLVTAIASNNSWAIGSVITYICGMLASYVTSTFYHGCTHLKTKEILRKCDHSAIYLHIAGTYVPFTLIVLRETGVWGWSIFSFVWLAAIGGLYLSFTNLKKHSHIETGCFVLMGCSILVAFQPLIRVLSQMGQINAFYWLAAGGIAYIIGACFYSWTKIRFMHTVFHLFVLVGSFCHIIAIYLIL